MRITLIFFVYLRREMGQLHGRQEKDGMTELHSRRNAVRMVLCLANSSEVIRKDRDVWSIKVGSINFHRQKC